MIAPYSCVSCVSACLTVQVLRLPTSGCWQLPSATCFIYLCPRCSWRSAPMLTNGCPFSGLPSCISSLNNRFVALSVLKKRLDFGDFNPWPFLYIQINVFGLHINQHLWEVPLGQPLWITFIISVWFWSIQIFLTWTPYHTIHLILVNVTTFTVPLYSGPLAELCEAEEKERPQCGGGLGEGNSRQHQQEGHQQVGSSPSFTGS